MGNFLQKTLDAANNVDVKSTCTSYLNIFREQVQPFMQIVFPKGSGLFQKNNVHCYTTKMVQE